MSIAEIADNKWEAQAAKAPIGTVAALAQLLLITVLAGIFVFLFLGTLTGLFGEKRDGLAENIGKMTNEAAPAN